MAQMRFENNVGSEKTYKSKSISQYKHPNLGLSLCLRVPSLIFPVHWRTQAALDQTVLVARCSLSKAMSSDFSMQFDASRSFTGVRVSKREIFVGKAEVC